MKPINILMFKKIESLFKTVIFFFFFSKEVIIELGFSFLFICSWIVRLWLWNHLWNLMSLFILHFFYTLSVILLQVDQKIVVELVSFFFFFSFCIVLVFAFFFCQNWFYWIVLEFGFNLHFCICIGVMLLLFFFVQLPQRISFGTGFSVLFLFLLLFPSRLVFLLMVFICAFF